MTERTESVQFRNIPITASEAAEKTEEARAKYGGVGPSEAGTELLTLAYSKIADAARRGRVSVFVPGRIPVVQETDSDDIEFARRTLKSLGYSVVATDDASGVNLKISWAQ